MQTHPTPANAFRLFPAFLVLFEFTTYIANDMIMPALPGIAKQFGAPDSFTPLSLSAYLLGGSSLQIVLGPMSDRFGRRPVLLTGALGFFLVTLFFFLVDSASGFMALRFFHGIGLCFITVVGYAALQEMHDDKQAVRLTAILASVALIAPLLGPILGGVIVQFQHWSLVYKIIAVQAIVAVIGLYWTMPETAHLFLNTEAVISKNPDLSGLPRLSWAHVLNQYSQLAKNRAFVYGVIGISFAQIPCLVWIGMAPVILCEKYGISEVLYGIWQIPCFSAMILGNIAVSKLNDRLSLAQLCKLGTLGAVVSLLITWLCCVFLPEPAILAIAGLSAYHFSLSFINSPLTRSILFVTDLQKGTASAFLSLVNMLLIASALALAPIVYHAQQDSSLALFLLLAGMGAHACIWRHFALTR